MCDTSLSSVPAELNPQGVSDIFAFYVGDLYVFYDFVAKFKVTTHTVWSHAGILFEDPFFMKTVQAIGQLVVDANPLNIAHCAPPGATAHAHVCPEVRGKWRHLEADRESWSRIRYLCLYDRKVRVFHTHVTCWLQFPVECIYYSHRRYCNSGVISSNHPVWFTETVVRWNSSLSTASPLRKWLEQRNTRMFLIHSGDIWWIYIILAYNGLCKLIDIKMTSQSVLPIKLKVTVSCFIIRLELLWRNDVT